MEYAEQLEKVLNLRRKISAGESGMIPVKGKEAEHDSLTKEIEKIRKEMRLLRYGKE